MNSRLELGHEADVDREYDPTVFVPDAHRVLRWYVEESAATRRALTCMLDEPYGPDEDETLDVFPARAPGAPVLVFIHGGFWQAFGSQEWSFVARGLHAHDITVVVTRHSLCPAVRISDITRQSRAAIAWVHREAESFHGDPGRIFVAGHSAGGQQAARLAATGWQDDLGLPADVIKGVIPLSGIFDLRPLLHSSMRRSLRLTPEIANEESPILDLPRGGPPLFVSVGGDESKAFLRQSIDYVAACRARELSADMLIQHRKNHFDVITDLADAGSKLCKEVVSFLARCGKDSPPRSGRRVSLVPSALGARLPAVAPSPPTPANEAPKPPAAPLVVPVARGVPLAPSFAQERLWFMDRLSRGSPIYNEPILIRIDGAVDPAVVRDALTEITRRHEALRTVFPSESGEVKQAILPPRPAPLEIADLSSLPSAAREAEAHRAAQRHARRPFDLEQGPLIRALFLRTSVVEARLVVSAHHIVIDGISYFHILVPELHALCGALSRREPSPLPEPRLHYADFAAWQRSHLTEHAIEAHLAYFRERLASVPKLPLPADFPRLERPSGRGARAPISIPAALTQRLRAIGHGAGVSLFTTLLAAWKTLLFRYSGQRDIVVGSAAAGRPSPAFERVIGFFSVNLVLCTRLDGARSFLELSSEVGATVRGAREHQEVPFERLVAALCPDRDPEGSPLYDTAFVLMPKPPVLEGAPRFTVSRFDMGVAKQDLYLELHPRGDGLAGHLEYATDRFTAATIERILGHLRALLEGIARDPSQRLSDLPLLTEVEEQQRKAWQGPRIDADDEGELPSFEELFEAQARRTPEAVAVEHGERRLTYAALDARANEVASALRVLGVGPETRVGLVADRSIEALVGLVGILKASGAYVPLDPDCPRERLAFMMADADLRIVLATSESLRALPETEVRVFRLDDAADEHLPFRTEKPAPIAKSSNLAYVIYTSGSTGRPKGVMVERRSLAAFARAEARRAGLSQGARVLGFLSLAFDASLWQLCAALPVGATLVLADVVELTPGPMLAGLLARKEIHAVAVTPSALAMTPHVELPALRLLGLGGEPLSADLVDAWAPGRRLFNAYGPTEATVAAVVAECHAGEGKPAIGRPLEHVAVHILDEALRPVPVGVAGELWIGGAGVARGYLNLPELTAERFVESPLPEARGMRFFRTGDRALFRPNGDIELLGRTDDTVKVRGYRVALGEIEATLKRHPAVRTAAVKLAPEAQLEAYVVAHEEAPGDLEVALKTHLRKYLPAYMIPSTFTWLERLPETLTGKLDHSALPASRAGVAARTTDEGAPRAGSLEALVAEIWREVLGRDDVRVDTPFFEAGGHSLSLARVQARLEARLGRRIDVPTLLGLPTIQQIAAHLAADEPAKAKPAAKAPAFEAGDAVAIVGMAIRAPGVRGPLALWEVVRRGHETIRALDPEALVAAGADPDRVRRPDFVPFEGVLDDAERFDAAFFGVSDADATWMDPQQRIFIECAYEALEHAGCDPGQTEARIGVFAGSGMPRYWLGPVQRALGASGSRADAYRAETLNASDFLASRVAFMLGLRGPAMGVQTACSTSLSAVHVGSRSLLAGDCDVAIAGGVSLASLGPRAYGHVSTEGGILSADGHCRPFDAGASGIVKASGAAIVVMKRLADAIAEGDTIHAIVRGSAMNNDGAGKVGFSAPSEEGVARVVTAACEAAGVDARSIGFVEAHGTGTRLGDPTEVAALTRAFRRWTDDRGFCALGSLKANLGHLDAAAGAASLIKATLALARRTIPPLASFRAANPLLDLPSTPFVVYDEAKPWPAEGAPRRAGVNALGLGGTNVCVILEEAEAAPVRASSRPFQLLCISARTETALAAATERLRVHLGEEPGIELADVSHTLALGRAPMPLRRTIVCRDVEDAIASLGEAARTPARTASRGDRPVVFLFPGHGAQHLSMGRDVYACERVFRAEVDRCFEFLREGQGLDLGPLLRGEAEDGEQRLEAMATAQPFLFTIEYAMARQLMAWGVRPAAMLGHSLGEYVAACVSGVLSLEDALAIVADRGRLMDATPPGRMLTVFARDEVVASHLGDELSIATYAPGCVVVSGTVEAIDEAYMCLVRAGVEVRRVRVPRASHSPMMRGIRDALRARFASVSLHPPTIPLLSNLTGAWLDAAQATSPDAWADMLCQPVRLREGIDALFDLESPIFVEVGPGRALETFVKAHARAAGAHFDVVTTSPGPRAPHEPHPSVLLGSVGRLWELGVAIDWRAFYEGEARRRIPLPTYPFEGRRYALADAPEDAPPPFDARARELARALGVTPIDEIPNLRSRLEELSASLVHDFFARRLGATLGEARSHAELCEDAGVVPAFAAMIARLVEILEGARLAQRDAAGRILLAKERPGRSRALAERIREEHGSFAGLVRFLEHCVGHYDGALTGEIAPIGVLYPDGTDAFYRSCMRDTATYLHREVYSGLACDVVAGLVARASEGRTARVLEIGAGHGTLTWPLVERLRAADVAYDFTDVGRSFLVHAEAEAEARGVAFVKTARFDLNDPPAAQGIEGPYDVIVGLNAAHVARDLPAALASLEGLLRPGGALVLVEVTRMDVWDELMWGLAPGYWDVARARGSLAMRLPRWEELLQRAGFVWTRSAPSSTARRALEEHGLLLAERSPEAKGEVRSESMDEETKDVVDALFCRLLGVRSVPPDATFFDLGGDSLLAVHLLSELRAETGQTIPIRAFLDAPTLEGVRSLLRGDAPKSVEVAKASAPSYRSAPSVEVATSAHDDTEEAILAFLQRFVLWMREHDDATVLDELWAHGSSCTLVPLDGKPLVGRHAVATRYARSLVGIRDGRVRLSEPCVTVLECGKVACATGRIDSDLTLVQGERRVAYRGVRASFVLVQQEGAWRAQQVHLSLASGEGEEESASVTESAAALTA